MLSGAGSPPVHTTELHKKTRVKKARELQLKVAGADTARCCRRLAELLLWSAKQKGDTHRLATPPLGRTNPRPFEPNPVTRQVSAPPGPGRRCV
jgi:hypothetical protein